MVSDALLRTKLTPPSLRPHLVVRPRLNQKFQGAQSVPLTLVSAPAGFGKTTATAMALATLTADSTSPFGWLSLDKGDDDPLRFWHYFLAALETAVSLEIPLASRLATPQPPPIQSLLTSLLNQLDALPAPLFLALDDLHLITDQAIFSNLTFLLEHAPPTLHLLLITRADPPLPLHKWRGHGQLLEIRADDLRFDREETAAFLRERLTLSLSAAETDLLTHHTEGWAVGLQLAGMALQGNRSGRRDFMQRFTHNNRYILDYLTEEVLAQQPEAVRAFLLQTSILDRLCGPLCDAVTQRDDGAAMLRELAQRNLFISPTGAFTQGEPAVPLFRYHSLFATLLQGHLRQQHSELLPPLHRRAAIWFEDNGDVETAVSHAFAAADYPLATRLLEKHANRLVMQGQARLLESWREQLPPEHLAQAPWTNLAFARALLLRGHFPQVEPLLQQAEAAAPADRTLRGEVNAFRAVLADTRGQGETALRYARQALEALSEENLVAQAMAHFALAGALRETGDIAAAGAAYDQAIPLSHAARLPLLEMLARAHLSFFYLLRGQLHPAAAIARPACASPTPHPATAPVYATLGHIHLEWNRLEEAEDLLQEALRLAGESGHNAAAAQCHTLRSRLLLAREDMAGAQQALEAAWTHFERGVPAWLGPLLRGQQVRFWLAQDEPAMAAHLLQQADGAAPSYMEGILDLARVRLYLYQKREAEAQQLLETLIETAVAQDYHGLLLEGLLLRALLQAPRPPTQSDLQRALILAEPAGYVLPFLEAGPAMAALLAAASHPYAKTILAAFPAKIRDEVTAVSPLPEPLTQRERDVLRLMATGLTYQQIADELILSVNTVRHHVKGLYGKLQVSSRAQAVAQARTLGLLAE